MAKLSPINHSDKKAAKVLFSFPDLWEVEYAQFAFNEVRDGTHDSPKESSSGVPLVTSKNLKNGSIDFSNTKVISYKDHEEISKRSAVGEGDLLFSMIGTIGNVAQVGADVHFSVKNVGLFRRNDFLLEPRFAYHWLTSYSYLKYLDALKRGGNQKFVSLGVLRGSPVPIPALAEQKVIAEKLDKLLAKVDSIKARLDAVPDTLKRFRQSVLAAAVSGKLTEEWRSKRAFEELTVSISEVREKRKQAWIDEQVKSAVRKGATYKIEQIAKKYKEPTEQTLDEFDLTLIKHIPEEWVSTNLDSVSIAVTGKTPKTTEESYWNGDIPFISPSQITNEGCLTLPERHVTQEGTSKTTILPSGSIMIVCIGTIGKVGLVDKEVAFNQQINALIPTQVVLPEFLFFWSKTLHSWLNKTSSAVVNAAIINKSRLCTAPCPLPSIAEQTEIVRRVEKLFAYADKVEAEVNAAQERVNKLTQSILAKAFRGELTAKWREQNPDLIIGDNSAEALLAKIKTEREKLKPKKRKAK